MTDKIELPMGSIGNTMNFKQLMMHRPSDTADEFFWRVAKFIDTMRPTLTPSTKSAEALPEDFPPTPACDASYNNGRFYSLETMHAYVIADRTARAAAPVQSIGDDETVRRKQLAVTNEILYGNEDSANRAWKSFIAHIDSLLAARPVAAQVAAPSDTQILQIAVEAGKRYRSVTAMTDQACIEFARAVLAVTPSQAEPVSHAGAVDLYRCIGRDEEWTTCSPETRAKLEPKWYEFRTLYTTPPAVTAPDMSDASHDVLAERARQINVEGWTSERDDKYTNCELARAAATYAVCSHVAQLRICGELAWPWHIDWFKRTTYRRDLVKAGALILAEIERLDRDDCRALRSQPKGEA